jgi:hypothetical protein
VIWDWEQGQGKGASNGKKVVDIMEQLVWRREEIAGKGKYQKLETVYWLQH